MPELVRFHAELLVEFHQAWRAARCTSAEGQEFGRLAHFTLEHAAKLYRYTGDEVIRGTFHEKPAGERRELVVSASRFLSLEDGVEAMEALQASDSLEDEDMLLIEESLVQLDSASEVLLWCRELSVDLRHVAFDLELAKSLAKADAQRLMLDKVLRTMPEYVLPALESLEGMRALLRVPVPQEAWWFVDAERTLAMANEGLTQEMEALFGPGQALDVRGATENFIARLRAFLGHATGAPVLVAAESSSVELRIDEDPDLRLIVTSYEGEGFRFELFYASTREVPSWAGSARLELRSGEGVLSSWTFDESTGVATIPATAAAPMRQLVLRRDDASDVCEVRFPAS